MAALRAQRLVELPLGEPALTSLHVLFNAPLEMLVNGYSGEPDVRLLNHSLGICGHVPSVRGTRSPRRARRTRSSTNISTPAIEARVSARGCGRTAPLKSAPSAATASSRFARRRIPDSEVCASPLSRRSRRSRRGDHADRTGRVMPRLPASPPHASRRAVWKRRFALAADAACLVLLGVALYIRYAAVCDWISVLSGARVRHASPLLAVIVLIVRHIVVLVLQRRSGRARAGTTDDLSRWRPSPSPAGRHYCHCSWRARHQH